MMPYRDSLLDEWARLGVGFARSMTGGTPDLERLLLDTAAAASTDPRLVLAAITWLSRYSVLVAEHRLLCLLEDSGLNPTQRAALGLMIDFALAHSRRHDRRRNIERVRNACSPAPNALPLFEVERRTDGLVKRAQRRACALGRKWNLWVEDLQPKYDTLRPGGWIIENNPALSFRADFRGDLRASILLTLQEDSEAGESVSELARRCGVTRTAVVQALDDLELGRHITRVFQGRVRGITLVAA